MKANRTVILLILLGIIFSGVFIYFKDNKGAQALGMIIAPFGMFIFAALTWVNNIENSQKNTFDSKFNLLLKQHNKQLENVVAFINNNFNGSISSGELINDRDYTTPNNYLFNHFVFSPYMRILFHILKAIDIDYGAINKDIISQKKYSSIVRSLIRSDILYLVAVNSLSDKNADFKRYRELLIKYDFFEHLNIDGPMCPESHGLSIKDMNKTIEEVMSHINSKIAEIITVSLRKKNKQLFNYKNYKSIREIHEKQIIIDTPTIYRLAFIYKKNNFIYFNEAFKHQVKKILCKSNIINKIDSLRSQSDFEFLYIAEHINRPDGTVTAKSNNVKIYLDDELNKIEKNQETYTDFLNRLAKEHNINGDKILFSRYPDCVRVFTSDYIFSDAFYAYALAKLSNKIISTYKEEVCMDTIIYFTNRINLSGIMKDQNDMLS